jgi:hypothetical protein
MVMLLGIMKVSVIRFMMSDSNFRLHRRLRAGPSLSNQLAYL